jgi:hypothetical protein
MGRVEIREEETDGDRLDASLLQRAGRNSDLVLVQGLEHLAGWRRDPFRDDVPVAALHERARLPGDVLHDRVVLRPLVAVFAAGLLWLSGRTIGPSSSVIVPARFTNVAGLRSGDPVQTSGVKVEGWPTSCSGVWVM